MTSGSPSSSGSSRACRPTSGRCCPTSPGSPRAASRPGRSRRASWLRGRPWRARRIAAPRARAASRGDWTTRPGAPAACGDSRLVECGGGYDRRCAVTAASERLGGNPPPAPARQVGDGAVGRANAEPSGAEAAGGPVPLWVPLLFGVLFAVHLLAGVTTQLTINVMRSLSPFAQESRAFEMRVLPYWRSTAYATVTCAVL